MGSTSGDFASSTDSKSFSTDHDLNSLMTYSTCESEGNTRDLMTLQQKLLVEKDTRAAILANIQGNQLNEERLLAEKNLLLNAIKCELLVDKYNNRNSPPIENFLSGGFVNITKIALKYYAKKQNTETYIVFVFQTADAISSVDVKKVKKNQVNVDTNLVLSNLAPDFEIRLRIFRITSPKMLQFGLIKKLNCMENVDNDPDSDRESLFRLWKETTITIDKLNESDIVLEKIESKVCKLSMELKAKGRPSWTISGFLDVSPNGIYWSYKWVSLDGVYLTIRIFPDSSTRSQVIDLRYCSMIPDTSEECLLKRSRLKLQIEDDKVNNYLYLATRSQQEFLEWREVLGKSVSTIQMWKRHHCTVF